VPDAADKEQDVEKIVVGTNEVVLERRCQDKKGRAVKDLKAGDFEVFERRRASGGSLLSPGHARTNGE